MRNITTSNYAIANDGITVSSWSWYDWTGGEIKEGGKNMKDMMGLYAVYVVDTKTRCIVNNERIIARDADKAKLIVAAQITSRCEFPENLEFFVSCIGEWEDKQPKEVKIVKE